MAAERMNTRLVPVDPGPWLWHWLVAWTGVVLPVTSIVPAADDRAEIVVELDRDQIYEGESVRYRVILNHVEKPSPPRLDGFDGFHVASAGDQSLNSRRVIIMNGRRSETVRYGHVYDFVLTPKRAGELEIPAPTAEVDGNTLRGKPLRLRVISPEDQDVVILEMSASRDEVYPMQPFTIKLTVAVKSLPGTAADTDPLAVQRTPPNLSIPWAEDGNLAEGLEPQSPWQRWLEELRSRRGGFKVNDMPSDPFSSMFGSPFDNDSFFSMFDDRRSGFRPMPQRTIREDRSGRKVAYWEYGFQRTFMSKRVGRFAFGPVNLKGVFGVRMNTRGDLEGERIYAVAKAINVTVKDVPLAGRPGSYVGAVGRFDVGAELVPKRAKVGDPMTLTLWLRGQGTLDSALAPKLRDNPEIAERFKVYEATEETQGDTRRFTYSLRPLHAKMEAFPSVALSYFDVEREAYVTLQTNPIPIEVAEADALAGQEIAVAAPPRRSDREIEVRAEGIFANVTDLSQLRDETVRPDRWFVSLGGLAGLFLVVSIVTQQVQRRKADTGLQRRRAAAKRAKRRLNEALREIQANNPRQAADHLGGALVGLIADVENVPEAGLTSRDVRQRLAERGLEAELVGRLGDLLETCDGARYGDSGKSLHGLGHQATALLKDLVKALRKKRLLS